MSLSLCSEKPFFLWTRNCNERQRRDAELRGQKVWPATTSLGPHGSKLSCRTMHSDILLCHLVLTYFDFFSLNTGLEIPPRLTLWQNAQRYIEGVDETNAQFLPLKPYYYSQLHESRIYSKLDIHAFKSCCLHRFWAQSRLRMFGFVLIKSFLIPAG